VEDLRDHADLAARAADRLADVARLDARELLVVLLDQRREPAEQSGAVAGGDGAPRGKRGLRARDGRVGLLGGGGLDLGDRLLGRRVDDDGQRPLSSR
jgi:hypothetical protein